MLILLLLALGFACVGLWPAFWVLVVILKYNDIMRAEKAHDDYWKHQKLTEQQHNAFPKGRW